VIPQRLLLVLALAATAPNPTPGRTPIELLIPVAQVSLGADGTARAGFGFLSSAGDFMLIRSAGEDRLPSRPAPGFWIQQAKQKQIEALLPSVSEVFCFGPETTFIRNATWIRVRLVKHESTEKPPLHLDSRTLVSRPD
jgi:hypothetical protein